MLFYSKPTPFPDTLSNEEWSNSGKGAVAEPADVETVDVDQAGVAEVSDSQSFVVLHFAFTCFSLLVFQCSS